MVNNFIENVINQESLRKLAISRELLKRFLSSFLFIPMIALVYFLDNLSFCVLCWSMYFFIGLEIFSPKISGHNFLRGLALFFCFFGISSFIYVHNAYGRMGCIFLICVACFTDMGAYFFGKWLKGPKLCPKISPNKTWAGFFGGFLICNAFIWLSNFMYPMEIFSQNFWILQVLILSSIVGDLLESSLKRRIGVKDLGKIFPGHGGLSDRLDSLMLVSIVFTIFFMFW